MRSEINDIKKNAAGLKGAEFIQNTFWIGWSENDSDKATFNRDINNRAMRAILLSGRKARPA